MPKDRIVIAFEKNPIQPCKASFATAVEDGFIQAGGDKCPRGNKGEEMGFLIKSAFWLSLVLLVLPLGGGKEGDSSVGAFETFTAAQAAISDMAGLCERQPDVCEVGRSALHTIGIRAKEGARIAYGVLDEHFGEMDDPIHTGSVPLPVPAPDVAIIPASVPLPAQN